MRFAHFTAPATLKQIPRLVSLSTACGWTHYGADQWNFLLSAGCDDLWVVEEDHSNALLGSILRVRFPPATTGTEATGSDFVGATGLGMMLVDPKIRGQGLGKALMKAAIEASEGELLMLGVASELGQPMYEKMGYTSNGSIRFLTCEAGGLSGLAALEDPNVMVEIHDATQRSLPPRARDALHKFDRLAMGLDRTRALEATLGLPGCIVACATDRARGTSLGVALMTGGASKSIGPVVGEASAAAALIGGLAATAADTAVVIKVSNHPELVSQLQRVGFLVGVSLVDMTYGGRPMPGRRELYHALLHPTLG